MPLKLPSEYKTLPDRGNDHKCFGCGESNPCGLHMKFYSDDITVVSWLNVPENLCGWDKLVHGGIISTILDEIMSWTTIYLLKKVILTKSITVDFLKPVYINDNLAIEGKILEIKNDKEAIAEGNLYNQKGVLCAKSKGTFATFSIDVAKRLGILNNDENIKYFSEL
ncbi:MAG: PaaI family thioesterase [Desulfobacterales bacterium]|nr:PaaI family thioesterase [Desulfobacterales bacterium]MBF0396709.1 PaaI family thioesterase [Desulfobacterales bacterium]